LPFAADYASEPVSDTARLTATPARRQTLLLFVGLELVLLYAPTVRFLVDRWTVSIWHNAHGLFVPPVVAWLIWRELSQRPDLRSDTGSASGFLFLIPALVLQALDTGIHTELLSAVAMLVALPGLSLLFLGKRRTGAIAFPLAFAVFGLPIPLGLTESAHLVLRHIAAHGAAAALPFLGIQVFLDGTNLQLVNGTLAVADACSGFSTLYAAMAVAVLTAFATTSSRRRWIVMLAAAPIAIASNVLRVILLVVLMSWRGIEVLHTPLHPMTGLLTFAVSLPLIFWLGGPTAAQERS
jgi:exosortase